MVSQKTPSKQQKPVAGAVNSVFSPQNPVAVQASQTTVQTYQGPVPHPETLRGYEEILPGAAERILSMAETEASRRHENERLALEANISAQKQQLRIGEFQAHAIFRSDTLGQILGVTVCIAFVLSATYLAIKGFSAVACIVAALPTAALVKAFFISPISHKQNKEGPPTQPDQR